MIIIIIVVVIIVLVLVLILATAEYAIRFKKLQEHLTMKGNRKHCLVKKHDVKIQ